MSSCKSGFSLVELLVATAIMAIVGALAVTCLFSVTHVWERCVSDATSGIFEFLDRFQKDASSAIAERGVDGDVGHCGFLLRESVPVHVIYKFASHSIVREAGHADNHGKSRQLFHGVNKTAFAYGFRNDAGEVVWCDSISSDSIPPDYIRLSIEGSPDRIVKFGSEM